MLIHSDVDTPYPRPGQDPYQVKQLGALFKRHPKTTIIWAHIGLGRVVHPIKDQLGMVERALTNPELNHVYLDISWDETAKYLVANPETIAAVAALINRHPDRFLFGTDEVGPTDQAKYLKIYDIYAPLFAQLTPEAREKVHEGQLRAAVRRGPACKVRAWEKTNANAPRKEMPWSPMSGPGSRGHVRQRPVLASQGG